MNTVNTHKKSAGETRTIIVGFGEKLTRTLPSRISVNYPTVCTPELLTGTPTVDELATAALTLSTPMLVTTDCEVAGRVIKASQGVQFTVSGGVAGTSYRIRVAATSDAAAPQTLTAIVGLLVYA
jgi:hypothetical protein